MERPDRIAGQPSSTDHGRTMLGPEYFTMDHGRSGDLTEPVYGGTSAGRQPYRSYHSRTDILIGDWLVLYPRTIRSIIPQLCIEHRTHCMSDAQSGCQLHAPFLTSVPCGVAVTRGQSMAVQTTAHGSELGPQYSSRRKLTDVCQLSGENRCLTVSYRFGQSSPMKLFENSLTR